MLKRSLAAAAVMLSIVAAPVADAEPPNLSDVKDEIVAYHDSGAYLTDLQSATTPAIAWIAERAATAPRPALVLDIDETSLSNWEALRANDFGRVIEGPCDALPAGPCGLREWDLRAQAAVLPTTLEAFRTATGHGVAVFFITGRDEGQRAATELNLASVGYTGYAGLIMEPVGAQFASAADFKAPQRAALHAQGYTVIANIGDQDSDLAGGFAERTFKLPNPFYVIP